jgi:hypothetical protein
LRVAAIVARRYPWANDAVKRVVLAGVSCFAVAAWGGPLNRAEVAAEPTWVLHLNCDALRPTEIGKYLLSEMQRPDVEPKFAAFQTFFSFDPRKQLHSVTFYSTGNAAEDGVMVVYADFEPGRLTALANSARNSQRTNYGEHAIYSWLDERSVGKGKVRFYGAIDGKRIVFAQRQSRVENALDVLDGRQPNLAASGAFAELGGDTNSNYIEAAARKLDLPGAAPTAALFRLAKTMKLQVSGASSNIMATLRFEASNEDISRQALVLANGAIAYARSQKDRPEVGKLAEGLSIKTDGTAVTATLALNEADAIALLKAAAAREADKKSTNGAMPAKRL